MPAMAPLDSPDDDFLALGAAEVEEVAIAVVLDAALGVKVTVAVVAVAANEAIEVEIASGSACPGSII
ncbi:hypothetical protein Tdes44962_MAKER04465 [Teratosphaeria destructans]|uniref:Uncharacterized protein n=1 Tax=Teratosphaeria destructans TaxID=418781 RepID=A0A9W7W015_9PEZI|nr:hypothetical protein Tdes44962_MAKER04465 [Teratosphaeria destructans]